MIDLRPDLLAAIHEILMAHAPDLTVYAFGSRATGTARPYSDLDLALEGSEPIGSERLQALRDAFEESDLPIKVDVVDWRALPQGLREAIGEERKLLRSAPELPGVTPPSMPAEHKP